MNQRVLVWSRGRGTTKPGQDREGYEQYANFQQRYVSSGGTIPPPPGPGPFPGFVELDINGAVVAHPGYPQHVAPHNHRPNNANAKVVRGGKGQVPPQRTNFPVNGRGKPGKHPPPESEFNDADDGPNVDPDADLGDDEYEEEDDDGEDYEEEDEEDPDPDDEELCPNPNLPAHPGVNGVRIGRGRGTPIRRGTTPQLGVRGGAGGGRGRGRGAESPLNGTENGKNQGRNSLFNPGTSLTVIGRRRCRCSFPLTLYLDDSPAIIPTSFPHYFPAYSSLPCRHAHLPPPSSTSIQFVQFAHVTQTLLTGPGNILTVADDLLKNDGQKFLEMMREEEAVGDLEDDSEDEEDEDCGEDEQVLGSEDDDEDLDRRRQRRMKVAMMMMRRMRKMDDEGEEVMTEEQKMEQGQRMFSIFAPRRPRCGSSRTKTRSLKKREVKKQNANQETNDKRKQQKLAKESEKAPQQTAPEEEQRKKREERVERGALRKAQEFEKAKKEEEKRKTKEEEGKKRIEHILILNVRAMSEQLQTTGKCKHDKFLPLNEPPLRRGVVDRTCFHVTPVYYLGWYIPGDEIPDYYPEAGGEMPTFWTKEVMIPWVRDYDAKYKSNERHCYFRPELAYVTGTKEPHLLVFISSNRTQEFIDMSRNEHFIQDAARIAHVKDFFGERQPQQPHDPSFSKSNPSSQIPSKPTRKAPKSVPNMPQIHLEHRGGGATRLDSALQDMFPPDANIVTLKSLEKSNPVVPP
ncbi:hypothetical protein F5051DRAFT_467865 [Lentinula edodes]|nr:hypothetical protein F5051DRAFT_467865 [Lentinula edodes]